MAAAAPIIGLPARLGQTEHADTLALRNSRLSPAKC